MGDWKVFIHTVVHEKEYEIFGRRISLDLTREEWGLAESGVLGLGR